MLARRLTLSAALLVASACAAGGVDTAGGVGAAGSGPADGTSATGGDAPAVFRIEADARRIVPRAETAVTMHPDPVIAPSGALYVLIVGGGLTARAGLTLDLLVSHDGGDSFAAPVAVAGPGGGVISHGESAPRLAVTPTEIHALWERRGERGHELVHARSVDFGHSFEAARPVPRKPEGSFNGFADMAVDRSGTVHVAWLDGRDSTRDLETFDLYVSASRDRGATFESGVRAGRSACPCCRPALAFGAGGRAYVAWRKVFDGDIRDIVVSASNDGGASFADPVRVAVDGWRLSGCPHSGPALAGNDERLWVAWFTAGGEAAPGIRVSWSDDGGRTFAVPVRASGDVLDANHPDLAMSEDGRVLLAFQGRDPLAAEGWGALRPWLVDVTNPAAPSSPEALPVSVASATYPAVAAGPSGQAVVAWTESTPQATSAAMARARKQ